MQNANCSVKYNIPSVVVQDTDAGNIYFLDTFLVVTQNITVMTKINKLISPQFLIKRTDDFFREKDQSSNKVKDCE